MIHPTALVDAQAELAPDVSVGAYSLIGAGARIDSGTVIGPHVVIAGATRIGKDNQIHAFCSLGGAAQDKKYQGEPTSLEIGDRNTIREFCTFNRGTANDVGATRVGDDNWIMAYVHVAHDCKVGNHTVFANNAQLAGHVSVGDYVVLGGFTGVHQFVHLGAHSFTGIAAVVLQDLPPYVTIAGSPAKPYGINPHRATPRNLIIRRYWLKALALMWWRIFAAAMWRLAARARRWCRLFMPVFSAEPTPWSRC